MELEKYYYAVTNNDARIKHAYFYAGDIDEMKCMVTQLLKEIEYWEINIEIHVYRDEMHKYHYKLKDGKLKSLGKCKMKYFADGLENFSYDIL